MNTKMRVNFVVAMLVLVLGAVDSAQGGTATWLGGDVTLPTDWNTAANWSVSTKPTSADNVLVGTATKVNTNTLDLAGLSWLLNSGTPGTPGGKGATCALEFGSTGGISTYTVQNGTISPNGEGYVKLGTNVTLNLNASIGNNTNKFYWLLNRSTLNIGAGTSNGVGRFLVYGGAGSTATLNLNATNYAGGIWLIGSGNGTTVSTTTDNQNLTVNVNANQAVTNTMQIGYTTGTNENKLVVRNGTLFTTTGIIALGGNSANTGNGRLVIGDATTTGSFSSSSSGNYFRIGTCQATGTGTGIVDVVNGTLTLNEFSTLGLAYGGVAGAVGIINLYTNGIIDTRSSFALKSGSAIGNAILNFNGGLLKVNAASAQRTNLIDSAVTVNVLDGGFMLDMNGKADTVINAALLNGGTGVGIVTLTNSTGTGKVAFTGANTYYGGTFLNNGTLVSSNITALGAGSVTLRAGLLQLQQSLTIGGNLSGNAGAYINLNAKTLTVNQGGNTVFTGAITNTGSFVKSGAGTLTLMGTNTYTGDTVISNGTLEVVTAGNVTLSDNTVVRIGTSGKMKLASGVSEKVYELYLNDKRAYVGTWGSTSSTAFHKNDTYFMPGSTGVLEVRTGTPNGTFIQLF
jgi:autotransporter-associated beta strand protein